MRYGLILHLLISVPCWCQTTTGQAQTTGPCSPAVTGNNNQFKITCDGIGEAQGKELLSILNRISKEKLDPKLVMEKLDEIQKGVSDIKTGLAKKEEQEAETERIRHTAPIIAVGLTPAGKGKVNITVVSQNLIPFEYRYDICTTDNVIVAGYPMAMSKVYPRADHATVSVPVDIQLDRVKDNYLEFHFTFKSLSFDELHLAGHAGQITVKYLISPDGISLQPIPND